jgi:hypothetical protein
MQRMLTGAPNYGPLIDLMRKLEGKNAEQWREMLNKFLRRENIDWHLPIRRMIHLPLPMVGRFIVGDHFRVGDFGDFEIVCVTQGFKRTFESKVEALLPTCCLDILTASREQNEADIIDWFDELPNMPLARIWDSFRRYNRMNLLFDRNFYFVRGIMDEPCVVEVNCEMIDNGPTAKRKLGISLIRPADLRREKSMAKAAVFDVG